MEMVAERLIVAPRTEVWRSLNDPEVLKACIPGCESIEATGPDSYKIAMVAAVGFIKAKFVGDLALQNKVADQSYDLSFTGSGGPAGFGKGSASVELRDAEGGTALAYQVKAQVGGKLAQVGARIIDGVAKKMAEDFFARLDRTITERAPAPSATQEPPQHAPSRLAKTLVIDKAPQAPSQPVQKPAAASRAWVCMAFVAGVAVGAVAMTFAGTGLGS
jgi:carbon monoxide dehydrogenase subunit G